MVRVGEGFEIFRDSRRINNHRSIIKTKKKSLLIPKIVVPQYLQQQGGLSRGSISPLNLLTLNISLKMCCVNNFEHTLY